MDELPDSVYIDWINSRMVPSQFLVFSRQLWRGALRRRAHNPLCSTSKADFLKFFSEILFRKIVGSSALMNSPATGVMRRLCSRTDSRTTFHKLFSGTSFHERDLKFCFTWYSTDITLCLWSGFICPRIRTFLEKRFHGLVSKKKALKSGGFVRRGFVDEMKLRSTSSADLILSDEITWITWKMKQIWRYGCSWNKI